MERVLRKPVAFVLTITLIFGAFVFPSFAGSGIYNEASIANDVDTGFEKQSEISEVKAQPYDEARTLSSDSHSGRFSLKLGKTGLSGSAICHIINSDVDLTKYNQVSMWVKPKGYNIPFTLYTDISGTKTTVGSIEVAGLKADVWQQVSFDLSSVSATAMHGLYAYVYTGKSLLIDDISFSKSYANSESWDLSTSSSSNTLPSVFSYQNNVGVTLRNSTTSSSAYENGAKVASIENPVTGQITDVNIDSTKSEVAGNLILTGGATYVDNLITLNQALFTIDKNGRYIYYYDKTQNGLAALDRLTNKTWKIYDGVANFVRTNRDGSKVAFVDEAYNLYYISKPLDTNSQNFSSNAVIITRGAISNMMFKGDNFYFVGNNNLYSISSDNFKQIEKIKPSFCYADNNIYNYNTGRFTFIADSWYHTLNIRDNNSNTIILSLRYISLSSNPSASMALDQADNDLYLIIVKENPIAFIAPGGTFIGEHYFYMKNSVYYEVNPYKGDSTSISSIIYSMDVNEKDKSILYVENKSILYLLSKTYSYDTEKLFQVAAQSNILTSPVSNAAIVKAQFSTLPNQAIVQMENGDIYSVDTRTKTTRLIVNGMVLYDVLDQGKLLLSDMKDTRRFLIYDPTSNSKEVFRLDNRSLGAVFTVQFNEAAKTVYYLNNEDKMQILQLTGAETQDKYAFMLNNDNKWWVYKNNAWKSIYTGSDDPSAELMGSMGMTAAEVNAITEKDFQKLPENAKADTLRIAVYLHSSSPYATPVLKSINVSTKDTEADLASKTAYGTRIKEYNKADFRDVSAIHVTENKDATDEIFYFLTVNDTLYSIRNGEVCDIGKDASQLFGSVKDNFMDVMTYGMSAKELSDFPAESLKQILITDNTTDKFGIVAVIKTIGKDTKEVKLDYALESLQKRFDDAVTTVTITLTDNTQLQFTSGEVSKEEIEKFADWVADRKYNRGPVFFTFHVGNQYKIINYYMIKMFSVE